MDIQIPEIDIGQISDKTVAGQVNKLFNIIEQQMLVIQKLREDNKELKEEIERMKGLPKKPEFTKQDKKASISVTDELSGEKTAWHKSKKGIIPIDRHIQLPEEEICSCGSKEFQIKRTTTKVTQGLILRRNNVAYHGNVKECKVCGKIHKTEIPEEIRGIQFDPMLRTLISYFKSCRTTFPLMHRMLTGLGIQISQGAISKIIQENSKKLQPAYRHLKETGYCKSEYLQSDATGAKRKDKHTGKITHQHAHVVSTRLISVFSITRNYNIKTVQRLLGKRGRDKPYVSDDGSANGNNSMIPRVRQLCWIHEIRHYKKLFPFLTIYKQQRELIMKQWSSWYQKAKGYKQNPTVQMKKYLTKRFDEITQQTTGYELLDKQLKTTRKKKALLLAFLDHHFLPIHNNQCEQDIREFVIQRKISRETKSVAGDKSLARHLSIVQTAHKQGLNVFDTLHGLLTGNLRPSVLTANIS